MKFVEAFKAVESDFMGFKNYEPIKLNTAQDVTMEINANSLANCTPKEDVPLEEYTHLEMKMTSGHFNEKDIDLLRSLQMELYVDIDAVRYNFVPVEAIETIYQHFTKGNSEDEIEYSEKIDKLVHTGSDTENNKGKSVRKINKIIIALNKKFFEREEEIEGMLIALLSKQHVLLVGEPGTGKSLLSMELAKIIDGSSYFQWLLTKYTTPEELFGALSIKELEKGVHKRNVSGKLPEAELVFLDEIFKSNSAILNSLLTLINERLYYNNGTPIKSPLVSLIGASNEYPEPDEGLEAIFDRILLRYEVKHIRSRDNFIAMLKDEGADTVMPSITMNELSEMQDEAEKVIVPDDIYEVISDIQQELEDEGIRPSARRVKNAIKALKAKAYIDGRNNVEKEDLTLLNHILWTEIHQRDSAVEIIKHYAKDTVSIRLDEIETEMSEILESLSNAQGDTENHYKFILESASKLKSLATELERMYDSDSAKKEEIALTLNKVNENIKEVTDKVLIQIPY